MERPGVGGGGVGYRIEELCGQILEMFRYKPRRIHAVPGTL